MIDESLRRSALGVLLSAGLLAVMCVLMRSSRVAAQPRLADHEDPGPSRGLQSTESTTVYLPFIGRNHPWVSPFGVESNRSLRSGTMLTRTRDLDVGWVRLNERISWRDLQPQEGSPIDWGQLAAFEEELQVLEQADLTPIVIVDDYPRWATINDVRNDNEPTSCGPLREDRFNEFAAFVRALVARYKSAPFDVRHWELGNEPDVDPDLVKPDNVFGCWGDIDDPYYGGEHYGEMVKVVGDAIKQEDPTARVWIGGLLLDRPETTDPSKGSPERFLEGILKSGAAPYFDIVPYHSYPPYLDKRIDHDNDLGSGWDAWGGGYVGKARFLRQTMQRFGVEKPVFLNETGLMCPPYYAWCDPPAEDFYQMQADHVVRGFVRAVSEDVMGVVWYTINGPGWRYTGLLDGDAQPKPVYTAYQELTQRLQNAPYVGTADYGDGIEAYEFNSGPEQIHVLWAREDETLSARTPQDGFVAAYSRDGGALSRIASGSDYVLDVGFEPIYIVRDY